MNGSFMNVVLSMWPVTNGSVMNVVCYECGLLWTGLLWKVLHYVLAKKSLRFACAVLETALFSTCCWILVREFFHNGLLLFLFVILLPNTVRHSKTCNDFLRPADVVRPIYTLVPCVVILRLTWWSSDFSPQSSDFLQSMLLKKIRCFLIFQPFSTRQQLITWIVV